MREYTVLYERGDANRGAIVPDLAGCVSLGDTVGDVQRNMQEAIAVYVETLCDNGLPVSEPRHKSRWVSWWREPRRCRWPQGLTLRGEGGRVGRPPRSHVQAPPPQWRGRQLTACGGG
jgi:predicted RNase H-like HicB family nuclease